MNTKLSEFLKSVSVLTENLMSIMSLVRTLYVHKSTSQLAYRTVIHSVCFCGLGIFQVVFQCRQEELNNWQSPADNTNVLYILKTLKICEENSNYFPK